MQVAQARGKRQASARVVQAPFSRVALLQAPFCAGRVPSPAHRPARRAPPPQDARVRARRAPPRRARAPRAGCGRATPPTARWDRGAGECPAAPPRVRRNVPCRSGLRGAPRSRRPPRRGGPPRPRPAGPGGARRSSRSESTRSRSRSAACRRAAPVEPPRPSWVLGSRVLQPARESAGGAGRGRSPAARASRQPAPEDLARTAPRAAHARSAPARWPLASWGHAWAARRSTARAQTTARGAHPRPTPHPTPLAAPGARGAAGATAAAQRPGRSHTALARPAALLRRGVTRAAVAWVGPSHPRRRRRLTRLCAQVRRAAPTARATRAL